MLPLCGGKPACSLRSTECFSVPLGRRLTKFQGPDLLAHLEWFSCTCRNLSEMLGGWGAGYSSKRATARQALLLKAWKVVVVVVGGEAFVFSGQRPSLLKLFPPQSKHFPQQPHGLPDPPLVRTPASWAVWVSLILFHCVFLEGCI